MGADEEEREALENVTEVRELEALNRLAGPVPHGEDVSERSRRREQDLLVTGHALARADSLAHTLALVSGLADPSLPLKGQAVLRMDHESLLCVEQIGFDGAGGGGGGGGHPGAVAADEPSAWVARTGLPVFLSSGEETVRRFPQAGTTLLDAGFRAGAYLPLTTYGQVNGVWVAAFEEPTEMTEGLRGLLTSLARLIGRNMERVYAAEADVALSQRIRSGMGGSGNSPAGLTVAARYIPSGGGMTVGGDWVDSIDLPNGRLGLVIGDVQGHDLHAAALMSQLRTAINAYATEGHSPDAILTRASQFLASLDDDRFATCVYMEADPATGNLRVARAGHPHPVLRLPDGTSLLRHLAGGMPLGVTLGPEDYPVSTLTLADGEILMLCTDGLIENGGHDMFSGWLRVRDAMARGTVEDIEGLADHLLDAVVVWDPTGDETSFRTDDDIALLLLRRDAHHAARPVPERRLHLTVEQDQARDLAEARAELRGLLHDWARPEQIDTVLLLASELLGNVLVHTEQVAFLRATVTGPPGSRSFRLEVTDRSNDTPHLRSPGELSSSGRGLLLLDALAHRWSVQPQPEGKTVWFDLDENGPLEV